jgi:cbb3-type cytochrome oxidase subunit 1
MNHMLSNRFMYAAVTFALIGVLGGIFMSASHDHTASPAHAHTLLLGWVSMAIFGIFFRVVPEAVGRLAHYQFWLMVIAVPVMGVGITLIMYGNPSAGEPLAVVSSFMVLAALVFFAISVLGGLGSTRGEATQVSPAE